MTTPDASVTLRTTRAGVRRRAAEVDASRGGAAARVPVVAAIDADPFDAYRRARGAEPSVFYETGGGRQGWGYFGVDPDAFVTVGGDGDGDGTAFRWRPGAEPAVEAPRQQGGALDTLAAIAGDGGNGGGLARGDCELPIPGGWFGWVSYDVAREIETLPDDAVDDRGLPLLQFARYPTVAAWREPHDGETELLLASAPTLADGPDAAFERGRERIEALAERIAAGTPVLDPPPVDADVAAFESDCGRAAYRERVRAAKAAIRDGETFQANLSHRLEAPAAVSPIAVYDALRRGNPAPYAGLLEFPGVDLVSASPELLLEVDGEALQTEPIAGTRPRGEDPAADGALERELRTDEKERAEHAMLVDLERNDLGKVAAMGSVDVTEYRRVDRYAAVMHLVSRVTARRRPDTDLADAVRAVFPGGTITGAPKPRTMELIEQLEATRRGPYTGSMAAIGFDDRAVFNIVIRTLVRTGDRYGLRVGAGIVHDSAPDAEYDETLDKARALLDAVEDALGDRHGTGGDGEARAGDGGADGAPSLEVSGE